MTKRTRRNRTPAFRAKVALAATKGDQTLAELAQQFDVHPSQIGQWRSQLLDGAAGVFDPEEGRGEDGAERLEGASRQDRRPDAGERFLRNIRPGGIPPRLTQDKS